MPPGNMKQTWMSFTNEDGTTVYHDFSIGASSGTPPPEEEMIPEMPDGKRPKYDGFRFEATTLEKREASLKNLQYLTFQTWWDEDAEDADLTLRVDGATTAGGGMTRRHMKIIFDLKTQHFEVRCG